MCTKLFQGSPYIFYCRPLDLLCRLNVVKAHHELEAEKNQRAAQATASAP